MTQHSFIVSDSKNLKGIPDKSVHLIVTSPPYPMIEMWDQMFGEQDPTIKADLESNKGMAAFEKMHEILFSVWKECDRVLCDNGFVCINIGDATRTIGGVFQLFSNHTKIINQFLSMGYCVLPDVHWRKQSNAPNKFMGSGMFPAGAYVTYEHEYILVFRKGDKREFKGHDKELRQKSAFFWEERNIWFSDLWDIKGTSQVIDVPGANRERSASYPFEIPYRLINMYSKEGDTILDPFAGLCTTGLACMAANRNSICVDIDDSLLNIAFDIAQRSLPSLNKRINQRLEAHRAFIESLPEEKRKNCYTNNHHEFLVKTRQEIAIKIETISKINIENHIITCEYC